MGRGDQSTPYLSPFSVLTALEDLASHRKVFQVTHRATATLRAVCTPGQEMHAQSDTAA